MSCQSSPKFYSYKTLGHLNLYAIHYYIRTRNTTDPPKSDQDNFSHYDPQFVVIVLTQVFSPIDLLVSQQSHPGCKTSAQENPGEAVGGRGEKQENRVVEMHTVDEIQQLKRFPFASQLSTLSTVI